MKITFKEKKTYFTSNQKKGKVTINKKNNSEVSNKSSEQEFSDIRVAAEVKFEGCPWPEEPEVVYFKNESDITSLVKMRMDASSMNDILSKTYTFEANSKHGMNKETAIKIDTVIKGLKCVGNGTVTSKVESENRTLLEYNVEF